MSQAQNMATRRKIFIILQMEYLLSYSFSLLCVNYIAGEKMKVNFYDTVNDELIKFAVIITKSNGKWVFCKHRERDTYEVPGGHRECGENIDDTAKRELYEETGAIDYSITPICVYSVVSDEKNTENETFGKLHFAEVYKFEEQLHSEIEKKILTDDLIDDWTYPLIQPKLIEEAGRRGFIYT